MIMEEFDRVYAGRLAGQRDPHRHPMTAVKANSPTGLPLWGKVTDKSTFVPDPAGLKKDAADPCPAIMPATLFYVQEYDCTQIPPLCLDGFDGACHGKEPG
jgi:hypothetical protein